MAFIGEIRLFAGNFAPAGWMFCEGQLLPISENDALFILIGTTYGGDGETTFALPDLRGRLPIHQGTGTGLSTYTLGEAGGVEQVTLTVNQIPTHSHQLVGTGNFATSASPQGNAPAASSVVNVAAYGTDQPISAVSPSSVAPVGGSQPHENFHPYLCINYIISLFGVFPPPS
jgi:microcystin-dependent protein